VALLRTRSAQLLSSRAAVIELVQVGDLEERYCVVDLGRVVHMSALSDY